MKPHSRVPEQDDLLRPRLVDMIDARHELVKLATLIDWDFFEREWGFIGDLKLQGFCPKHKKPCNSKRTKPQIQHPQSTWWRLFRPGHHISYICLPLIIPFHHKSPAT